MKTPKENKLFKPYNQNQQMLIPPSIEDFIDKNHPVRVVNKIIDAIDIRPLLHKYRGGGRSSYNPLMLLKVVLYSYMNNIYSTRKMEQVLRENVHFMYLSGMQHPDHNTLSRFRSDKLEGVLNKLFNQVVMLLAKEGHISLKEVFIDGTKIEANANKYTFVWGKSIKYNEEKIYDQLKELWAYSRQVLKSEEQENIALEFHEINPKTIKETIEKIDQAISASEEADKKIKQKVKYAKKNWPDNLRKYEQQKGLLGQRNSYSKTDTDATFMRMKEDHMMNGQLKAGYNAQIATNNQMIVSYGIYQKSTDTTLLSSVVEQFKEEYNEAPEYIVADAGYGSEENYRYLEQEKIKAVVKYNTYDKEEKRKKKNQLLTEDLHYNKQGDYYICHMGQHMNFIGNKTRKTSTGFITEISRYQAQNCEGCPLHGPCHKGNGNRILEVNHRLNKLKAETRELLESEVGDKLRRKRKTDVEPVFGNIKQNMRFTRFMLRGIKKVGVEMGLLAFAHNFRKLSIKLNVLEPAFS